MAQCPANWNLWVLPFIALARKGCFVFWRALQVVCWFPFVGYLASVVALVRFDKLERLCFLNPVLLLLVNLSRAMISSAACFNSLWEPCYSNDVGYQEQGARLAGSEDI